MDLNRARASRLVESATSDELFDAADRLSGWTDQAAATVDHVLVHWTQRVLHRSGDSEGAEELQSLVVRLSSRHPAGSLRTSDVDYIARWAALRDVLEAHLIALSGRAPQHLLDRPLVPDVLDLLEAQAPAEVPQATVREKLNRSESQVSQLLSLMESHGLVERRKHGRERWVRATPVAAELRGWSLDRRGIPVALETDPQHLAPAVDRLKGIGFVSMFERPKHAA